MKSLHSAIALALALPSASAFALNPDQFNANPPVVLRISGATASDNTLRNLFALDPAVPAVAASAGCVAGTMDYYFSGTLASPANYLISCTATANVPGLSGSHIVVVKETAGGSINGISPVARQTNLPNFITPTQANLVGRCVFVDDFNPPGAALTTYGRWDCDGTGSPSALYTPAPPHVGISDVDPTTAVGTAGVTAADAAALSADPGLQVLFAPIVSVALRNRLQDIQYGAACDDATTERETLACIPSLASSVLAGIFSNKIEDWNQVEIAGVRVGANFADQPARVCRRADTSGTQTAFKIHYLNQGCNTKASANAFVQSETVSCSTSLTTPCAWNDGTFGGHRVFAGGGSGDVRSCVNFNSTTQYRLGVASTEALPDFTAGATANRFRYIRVDGQESTLYSTQQGRYNFFTENTLNTRTPDATPVGARPIWTYIRTNIDDKEAATGSNTAFQNAACTSPATGECDTGVMIRPEQFVTEPAYPLTAAGVRDAVNSGPINTQSRTLPGDPPNNCNTPFRVLPGAGL